MRHCFYLHTGESCPIEVHRGDGLPHSFLIETAHKRTGPLVEQVWIALISVVTLQSRRREVPSAFGNLLR